MSASQIVIEEESGTYAGRRHHPHNGYYAGDFWTDWHLADHPTEARH